MRAFHNLEGKEVEWEEFQCLFKGKYLTTHYSDERAKEFHELKFGKMTMDGLVNNFTHLLCYVPYLKDENAKIQRFLSCLPPSFKERIEYDKPKTMDKVIRKS